MWVPLDQVSARPLADTTVDVHGHFCVAAMGPGVLVPGARGPGQGGPSSLGACPRRCGTLVAGAPFLSRSTVTTGGFWSGHSAFMTSAVYNPQPHATRTLLTQSLAAHGLRNPRLRRAGPARAPGAAPDPLPGQRRASDLTRLRSARDLLFPRAQHSPPTAEGSSLARSDGSSSVAYSLPPVIEGVVGLHRCDHPGQRCLATEDGDGHVFPQDTEGGERNKHIKQAQKTQPRLPQLTVPTYQRENVRERETRNY